MLGKTFATFTNPIADHGLPNPGIDANKIIIHEKVIFDNIKNIISSPLDLFTLAAKAVPSVQADELLRIQNEMLLLEANDENLKKAAFCILGKPDYKQFPKLIADIINIDLKAGFPIDEALCQYKISFKCEEFNEVIKSTPIGKEIISGSSCKDVLRNHGISLESILSDNLQIIAVKDGPAGKNIIDTSTGKGIKKVAKKYGIVSRPALLELVKLSTVGERIIEGENCNKVAQESSIDLHSDLGIMLQKISISEGKAGREIREGHDWKEVMINHGLTDTMKITIQKYLIDEGQAGQELRKGEIAENVRIKHNLHYGLKTYLQEVAVKTGPAGREAYDGINCKKVADKYGIDKPVALYRLECFAVDGIAGQKVAEGADFEQVVSDYGFGEPHAISKLFRQSLPAKEIINGESFQVVANKFNIVSDTRVGELLACLAASNGKARQDIQAGRDYITVAAENGIDFSSKALNILQNLHSHLLRK